MMKDDLTKRYRIPRQRISLVRDGSVLSSWRVFSNSHQIFEFAREAFFADVDRELFFTILFDSKNRMIGVNLVSQGSIASSIIHPRECFKPAVAASAAAVAFVHNHPSSDPAPSREDRDCTERLVKSGAILGIRVLDHVICGDSGYFSFADAGILEEYRGEQVREAAAGFNNAEKREIKPVTIKRRVQMKTKKDRKGRKPAEMKPGKSTKSAAPAKKSTIKQVVIDLITGKNDISNEEMIAAVKAGFPKSAFNAKHAAWYRSQARKGLLTGTPISIPSQTKRLEPQSE